MRRIIREPLLHFLVLGAALFVGAGISRRAQTSPGSSEIVVSAGQVQQIVYGFSRTWSRPPTEQELKGLIEDYVREEISYRQAVAMGLDRDDTIVRRRMRQKLEFLTEDLAAQAPAPTDAELQAFLAQHADLYREEPRLAFEHIYFNREKRRARAAADAEQLLAQLNGPAGARVDINTAGDTFLLPFEFALTRESEIGSLFGDAFAKRLAGIQPGGWLGPVESSYGLHLVRIHQREDGSLPPLAKVREAVAGDFLTARRKQTLEAAYQKLLANYTVRIEWPKPQVAEAR